MPKLNFRINRNYLLAHALLSSNDRFSSTENQEDILALQKTAQEIISQRGYAFQPDEHFLFRHPEMALYTSLGFFSSELQDLARTLKRTSEWERILEQTRQYQMDVEAQWLTNYDRTLTLMQEMTGLRLGGQYTVYLTHPSLRNGHYLDRNKVTWGHHEDWPNFSTVYLWHEVLHSKLPDNGSDEVGHSVIELATDEELRIRLNGGSYPPWEGHIELSETKEKILPYWRGYIPSPRRRILEFVRGMKKLFNRKEEGWITAFYEV